MSPRRLQSLDALRGLAAIAVVFWHWQNFFAIRPRTPFERELQPYYDVFLIFYEYGALAVDLFFLISGFIFFLLYREAIEKRSISSFEFFVLRFSRLYPLHFATLLVVAVAQLLYIARNGAAYVYENVDIFHFVLNVFLASSIGFESGYSFNGPIWSVSVEAALYTSFFVICAKSASRPIFVAVLSALGFWIVYQVYPPIGRGLGSFFLGGVTCFVYLLLKNHRRGRYMAWGISSVAAVLWGICLLRVYHTSEIEKLPLVWGFSVGIPGPGGVELILFPITVLALAILESNYKMTFFGLGFLGEISYSIYLLHFPLQLLLALTLPMLGIGSEFFMTGLALFAFFLALIILSALSYRYFEIPVQNVLRRKWLSRDAG